MGNLEHFENLGHEFIGQRSSTIGPITLRRTETIRAAQIGTSLGVSLHPNNLHFFDSETECRLE